jgi:hypothetical protein
MATTLHPSTGSSGPSTGSAPASASPSAEGATSRTCRDCQDGLGQAVEVPHGGWRHDLRNKPGVGQLYRIGVFVAGLLFVLLGFGLAVLPGPLTIPPLLVGLWIWSTEFAWAKRLFTSFRRKAEATWAHAKQHPVSSSIVTVGGLVGAVVAMWAVKHYALAEKAKDAVGL